MFDVYCSNKHVNPTPQNSNMSTQVCAFDYDIYDGAFASQCEKFFDELKLFCSKRSYPLHMTHITRTLLGYSKSSEYPSAKLACDKAYFGNLSAYQ